MYFVIQKDYTGYPSTFVLIVNMLFPLFRLWYVKYQTKPECFDRDQCCHFKTNFTRSFKMISINIQ